MILVMRNLRALANDTGAAIVVIHHQRKSNGGVNTRAGDSLRGHSSIEGSLDLALLVMREEGGNEVVIKSTKTRGVDVPTFGARFEYTHKPGSQGELATARFTGAWIDSPCRPQTVKDTIVDIVARQGPISQRQLVGETRAIHPTVGVHKIRGYISDLVTLGIVTAKQGRNNSIVYEKP